MRMREWRGPSSAWWVICILSLSCGAEESVRSTAAVRKPAVRYGAATSAPAPGEIAGAAAHVDELEIPADTEPLGARFAPRDLEVPEVAAGRAATFRVDGERRGWIARLPEHSANHLLTPVYGHGRVYVGGGFTSTKFYALNAHTGGTEWATMASDGGPTAAIIDGNKVLFNTESCTLFVVDARTGRELWKRWLGDPLMGQPAAANNRVFSGHIRDGGQGYGMTAMDLRNGNVLWTQNISADVLNAPALDGDSVYFTTMDGVLWKMDQRSGRVRWRRSLRASSAPWLDGAEIHVARRQVVRGENGRRVRKEQTITLAKSSGEVARELDGVEAPYVPERPDSAGVQAGWAYEGSRPTVIDGRMYQAVGNEVQARDARSGELLWRRRYTDDTNVRPSTAPAIAGAQLVFGTRDGVLFGLDIDTGMTTFAYDVGEPIGAEPTVAHGWVYAATTRGAVVGLELDDETIDGWYMWGGNAKHTGPVESAASTDDARAAQRGAHQSSREPDRPTEGALELGESAREGELPGFPLERTTVDARVSGYVARVKVEQTFQNPFERAVEAVYLFPLPDDAAVDAMELRAGDRVVRGQIRRREQARREYRAARERGALASLLEQERPNLFRQSVANIPPGGSVRVALEYTQVLPYEEGSYRFIYPMVAGPRYVPAGAGEAGSEAEADQASNVRQVALPPGASRRDRVEVSLTASLGTPLHDVSSPTHDIDVERDGTDAATVHLDPDGVPPDRDLDVRFRVAGDAPSAGIVASAPSGDDAGFMTLLVHPRLEIPEAEVSKREIVFVVDTSSSMHGRPLELAKAAMTRALDGLREGDTFRVVSFSDGATALSETPLAATRANVARAKEFVESLRALGATEMVRGVRAALDPPADPERMRMVLFVTDGYIGNETEIFRETHERLGQARLFAFGVGSAVNRYMLSRLAEVGRGEAMVVTLSESPEEAADRFHERIARPYLTDVQIDWGGLEVADVYPRRVPDLFGDRPVVVHARYRDGGDTVFKVRGRIAGRAFEQDLPVSLPRTGEPRREVQSLWARTAIRDRMLAMALRPTDTLREEITDIGLSYGLLTQWTAFVAVDETPQPSQPTDSPDPARVDQPAVLPNGVDFGGRAQGAAVQQSHYAPRMAATASGSSYGLGGYGYGRGGGGVGEGTIGLGALGVLGRASGTGAGFGAAPVAAEPIAEEREAEPAPRPTVGGSLDRSVIARHMAQARTEVRRAYETELRSDPDLRGRIVVRLTIAPDGTVTAADIATDTVGSPTLNTRILAILRRLRFPEPAGAGSMTITYPFAFAPP